MGRNCKRLFRTIRETANQLDMAALLSCYGKAEQCKYLDDVLTGKSFSLGMDEGVELDVDDDCRLRDEVVISEVFTL